ncbi:MAG TPA: MmgE/PrpD family protein, partial [Xanthobacteraceae bacterium]|nr:MmgE/PrpD family protein [Xanthobacteraceae bacterium]
MAGETKALAQFASALRYDDIPAPVIAITKACLLDTVGVALFCSRLPWSRSVEDFARHAGGNGASTILSASLPRAGAPAAALANGTFSHAFEFDNLRQPSVGVHPGATAHVGALAVAEEYKVSGRDFLTALVAGCEAMLRVGAAAKQTSEEIGFHAPGLAGVFGTAIAAAKLMGQDVRQTTMAIGIGASFCSGLLAFVRAGNGGMVKRLHMGRAAEGGVTAAYLAARGFEGPDVALEGKFGFLDVYAHEGDPALLTEGLGTRWDSHHIWFK